MTFEEVKNCIKQLNVISVKITDTNGKKIMEFLDELSPENMISKLETFSPTLQQYGRVNLIAANASQYKQNWKDCYQWPVIFSGVPAHLTPSNDPTRTQTGFVSHNEATLMAQLASMQMQMQFNQKIAELEKKIDISGGKEEKWERLADKYFPIASSMLGFKMEPEQMNQMMQMYQLQNLMSGKVVPQQQGMAGLNIQANPSPTIQSTEEEKKTEEAIVNELTALSQKIPDQKILILIKALNTNPSLADMAINILNQPKTT